MSRSGGSLHVQPGVINLRGAQGAQDSPSSVSLTGLAGLEAAQGSLTSNVLFGSLNLVSYSTCMRVGTVAACCGVRLRRRAMLSWDTILPNLVLLCYCSRPGTRRCTEPARSGNLRLAPPVRGLHRPRRSHAMPPRS